MAEGNRTTQWLTKRSVITAAGFITATAMVYSGKMSDQVWVYAVAVFVAGHHAAEIVKAFRGRE